LGVISVGMVRSLMKTTTLSVEAGQAPFLTVNSS